MFPYIHVSFHHPLRIISYLSSLTLEELQEFSLFVNIFFDKSFKKSPTLDGSLFHEKKDDVNKCAGFN